ncbi:hypothetical protein SAMN05444321_6847 [Bradyrhizobium lablabi]|nr:hypothetical protein SAMN05444321_6847 [Bradyrhizobium lablabi]
MNARDLSEPPNGTTSGCPPPSPDHNYRGLLHTQQRNRSEQPDSAPFPNGVAQITRIRDRGFHANYCLCSVFYICSICRLKGCREQPAPSSSPPNHLIRSNRTAETAESLHARHTITVKAADERAAALRNAECTTKHGQDEGLAAPNDRDGDDGSPTTPPLVKSQKLLFFGLEMKPAAQSC